MKEVNWSEIARIAFLQKMQPSAAPSGINRVISLLTKKREIDKLQCLLMKAEVMSDEDIVRTLQAMGKDNGNEILAQVNDLLRTNLVDTDLSRLTFDGRLLTDIVKESMEASGAYELLSAECEAAVARLPSIYRDTIWLFSQYHTLYLESLPGFRLRTPAEGFDRTAKLLSGREDTAQELIRAGILYVSYYSSKVHGYESYIGAEYARPVIAEYARKFDGAVQAKLSKLCQNKVFREFLEWLTRDSLDYRVIVSHDEENIRKKANISQSFDQVLREFVQEHLVLIEYSPGRSTIGKRTSEPPRWVFELTPACKRNIVPYLLKILAKKETNR